MRLFILCFIFCCLLGVKVYAAFGTQPFGASPFGAGAFGEGPFGSGSAGGAVDPAGQLQFLGINLEFNGSALTFNP